MINIIIQQKTKLLSFLLVVSMLFGIFAITPISVFAAPGETFTDGDYTYKVIDDIVDYTVSLLSVGKNAEDVVLPEKVSSNGHDFKITSIEQGAFDDSISTIRELNMKNTSISDLPESMLANAENLEKVSFSDKLASISNKDVFRNCSTLQNLELPATLKTVGKQTFSTIPGLQKVYIFGNTDFTTGAFNACKALTDVYCYGEPTFNSMTFSGVTLSNVTFHVYEGSRLLEPGGFIEIKNAKSEIMSPPETTTPEPTTEPEPTEPDTSIFKWEKINDGTEVQINGFKDGQVAVATLDIDSEIGGLPVTRIGANAFESIAAITTINIPSSVKVIDNRAFYGATGLKSVTFADASQITLIGNEAFALPLTSISNKLNEISLPESLKSIGNMAFAGRKTMVNFYVYSKDAYFGTDIFVYEEQTEDGKQQLIPSVLKIYCSGNSTAEEYALENGITVRYLDLDTSELQAAYDKAQAIDSTQYTAASYANLTIAMTTANRVLKNKNATQVEINAALAALNEALDKLVPIGGSETTAPTESSTSATESSSASEYVDVLIGDANNDGRVSVQDATAIQAHIVSLTPLTGVPLVAADVNEDERITVIDATLVQKYIVDQIEEGNHTGETAKKPLPDKPQPTDPPTTTEPPTGRFYMPNDVKWLNEYGAMIWIYNNKTEEYFVIEGYDEDAGVFYTDNLPADWTDIGFYRTPYETTEETFESGMADYKATGKVYNETDHPDTCILNVWKDLADRGTSNCFQVLADGVGSYTTYDPNVEVPTERTLYFDNSKTQWSSVYFYSWSYNGLRNETAEMEFEGGNIWSITIYEELPKDNVQGFLFVSKEILNGTDGSEWAGASQTGDLATEAGKNIFIPSGMRDSQGKYGGSWGVYNPETGEIIS